MSGLSVLTVQKALQTHANSGHDIISNSGVTFSDDNGKKRNYPMTLGSLLTIDHDNLPEHMLTTLVPVSESGNIARITSLPYTSKQRSPWVSRSVRNPHIDSEGEGGSYRSFYINHPQDKRNGSEDIDIHEYLQESSKIPSLLTTHSPSPYGFRPREIPFTNIRHHDTAEAAWHELVRSTWQAPDKPDEINVRNIGGVVLVNHHPTQSL